ncbi:MAG: Clp protease N-terminal domain-containing protein [Candidatus Dormibacteraceae bacterium]
MNKLLGPERLAPLLVSWEIGPHVSRGFELEAKRDGAKFIEAEHMLLALAADPDGDAARTLTEAGLDHQRLVSALQEERRRTLAFAGMSAPTTELVAATELDTTLSFGTSAKTAIRRALLARQHRRGRSRLKSSDLLLGILQAELGTVPRALAIAGVDRSALITRVWGLKLRQSC